MITVTGGASGAQSEYPLRIAITHDGDMQADFDDLRFTSDDGVTLLDAWLESKVDSTSAVVYVKANTPANGVKSNIYGYYGNLGARSDWDVDPVFVLHDDFDDNSLDSTKWVESTNAGSLVVEQNGQLECASTAGVSGFVRSYSAHIPENREFIVRVDNHCVDGGFKLCPTIVASDQWDVYSEANWYNYQLIGGNIVSPSKKVAGASSQVGGDSPALTTPYWLRIRVTGTTIYFDYVNNQSAAPSDGQWVNISSEAWSIGTGITQANYIYLTGYNTPTTGEPHWDNMCLRKYVANPATYSTGDEVIITRRVPRVTRKVALYTPLNEGTGNPHDSSSYGNNGTISGSTVWGNGDHGRHIEFKGWTDKGYVDCGSDISLQPTEQFAIGCWIRPAASQEYCFVTDHGNYGVAGSCDGAESTTNWSWQLRYGSEAVNCSLGLQVNTAAGSKWAKLDYALVADQWKWIFATFTPTDVKIYVDAVLKGSDTFAATTINTHVNNKILLGVAGWGVSGTYYEGDMADFKLFIDPPSTTEATAYFNAAKGRFGL